MSPARGSRFHHGEGALLLPPASHQDRVMRKTPCQQIVWDVLPAIRAALAAELVRNGIAQQEVARLLEIAPSAVSQYLSGKRGYRIVFQGPAEKMIEGLAREIRAGGVPDITARICAICREIRDDQAPCTPLKDSGPRIS
jgi:predicted transcriptional regulator